MTDQTITIPHETACRIRDHLISLELLLINLDVRKNVAVNRAVLDRIIDDPQPMVGVIRGRDGK